MTRPWCITQVFLFENEQLMREQTERGRKPGTAASLLRAQWPAAQIYPGLHDRFPLSEEQRAMLAAFASE